MDETIIGTQEYEQVRPIPKLNLPDLVELECIRPKDDDANLIFYCEPAQVYKGPCTECGAPRSGYDSRGYARDRRVHDISMGLVHVDIVLRTPRFLCKCGASFSYPFKDVLYRKPFTKRLYEQIKIRALKEPFVKIANEYGITITTVAKIFEEHASGMDKSRKVIAPRVLGIDEKRYGEWQKLIPAGKEEIYAPMYTLQRSMNTWKEHIFNYFDTDKECRLTNATVEGINSLIGHLNNEGRGYKFNTLRLKCLLHKEAADKPHFMRVSKINYDFRKTAQPQQGMMQRSAYGTGYADGYLDSLFSGNLQDEVQVSGGGVFIDGLLSDIKDRL